MSLELDAYCEPLAPGVQAPPRAPLPWSEGWQRLFLRAVCVAWDDLSRPSRRKPAQTDCNCGAHNVKGKLIQCRRCAVALRPTHADTALAWIAAGCPVEFNRTTVSLLDTWDWPVERVYANALEVFQNRPRSGIPGIRTVRRSWRANT